MAYYYDIRKYHQMPLKLQMIQYELSALCPLCRGWPCSVGAIIFFVKNIHYTADKFAQYKQQATSYILDALLIIYEKRLGEKSSFLCGLNCFFEKYIYIYFQWKPFIQIHIQLDLSFLSIR